MKRFVVEQAGTSGKVWKILDTLAGTGPEFRGERDFTIRFASYDRVQLVCNALNAEWDAFLRNPS